MDAAGERANETGWTREARRAQKKAEAKAKRQARFAAIGRFISAAWNFFLGNLLLWLAVAGVIATATWEWWNTSRGWHNLYPGLPAVVPYIGAFGAIVLYFFGFRMWRELSRAEKPNWQWLSTTIAAYFVCVAGVFIATATASERADRVARESRTQLLNLRVQAETLQAKVELNDPELLELGLAADRRTLDALVQTATLTYGMKDLDMGSGCPAPAKKFTMERLCAQANGGIDPFNGEVLQGYRTEVQKSEKRLKDARADVEALDKLKAQIRDYPQIQGDETADALAAMFSTENGTGLLGLLLLALSSAFLYGSGWLADWVVEQIERLRVRTPAAKATRA